MAKHKRRLSSLMNGEIIPHTYDLLMEKYGPVGIQAEIQLLNDIKKHKEMEKNCNKNASMTPLEIINAYRAIPPDIGFQKFFQIIGQIKGRTPEERKRQLLNAYSCLRDKWEKERKSTINTVISAGEALLDFAKACNETVKNNDMKNIQLSVEQARELLGKNPEVDVLILANFTKEELCGKPKLPTSLYELTPTGYFINYDDAEIYGHPFPIDCKTNLILFNTRKQAESAVAKAQLSRFMAAYNGDWTPDWNNSLAKKYCIIRRGNELEASVFTLEYHFLAFKTAELRNEFMKNFKPQIEIYVEL